MQYPHICKSKALGGVHAPYAENVPGYEESTAQPHSNRRTPCFSASEKVDRINALPARVANNGASRSHATPSLERMRRYSAAAQNPQTSVPNAPTRLPRRSRGEKDLFFLSTSGEQAGQYEAKYPPAEAEERRWAPK